MWGEGSKDVSFASKDAAKPANFYLLSYPAHAEYPTAMVKFADMKPVELGSAGDLQQAEDLQGDSIAKASRAASW